MNKYLFEEHMVQGLSKHFACFVFLIKFLQLIVIEQHLFAMELNPRWCFEPPSLGFHVLMPCSQTIYGTFLGLISTQTLCFSIFSED